MGSAVNRGPRTSLEGLDQKAMELRRLLDSSELAELLGVTPRHIRRLVTERRIPYVKWGHFLRFDPDEVERWLRGASVPADVLVHPFRSERSGQVR